MPNEFSREVGALQAIPPGQRSSVGWPWKRSRLTRLPTLVLALCGSTLRAFCGPIAGKRKFQTHLCRRNRRTKPSDRAVSLQVLLPFSFITRTSLTSSYSSPPQITICHTTRSSIILNTTPNHPPWISWRTPRSTTSRGKTIFDSFLWLANSVLTKIVVITTMVSRISPLRMSGKQSPRRS